MDNLMISTVIGALAGILGTGLGGVIAFFINNPSKRWLSTILSISAGLMLGVVCFDLLPRSFELGSFGVGLLGTLIGVISMAILQEVLSKHTDKNVVRARSKKHSQTGILIGIGIALHNFPEGLAIGVGFTSLQSFGLGKGMKEFFIHYIFRENRALEIVTTIYDYSIFIFFIRLDNSVISDISLPYTTIISWEEI